MLMRLGHDGGGEDTRARMPVHVPVYARNTATYHFTVTGLGLLDGRSLKGEDDSVVNHVYLYHCFHCNLC